MPVDDLLAGLTSGFATTIVTHPLDVIKIRLQLSQDSFATTLRNLHGQYYRGIMPNLIGNISAWGIYFALYGEFKRYINTSTPSVNFFTASILSGVSTSILTNPIWVLKTRILGTNEYKSMLDGIQQMLHQEGVLSFWKGTIPSLFQVFQASLQITIYDNIKRHFNIHDDLTTIYASSTSKIISTLIMYPTQVVRARLQNSHAKTTITTVIQELYSTGRLRAFYRGLSANILRVVPATCITFVVYEKVKRQLTHI